MRGAARVLLLASLALAGCDFVTWHSLSHPGESQVVRVASGDRYFFTLDEEEGCRWDFVSDDPDVAVRLDHGDGKAKAEVRIHRGYDGPSAVRFTYARAGTGEEIRHFTLSFYRNTGDRAFWE